MLNPNWTRWIHASLTSYFKNTIETVGLLSLDIEGQKDKKPETLQDWAVFWTNGPDCVEHSKDCWYIDMQVNVSVTSVINRDDTHVHKRKVGIAQASFVNSISVFKYGNTVDVDDQSYLGCLQLKAGIQTTYYGEVAYNIELEQSSIEAHYRMILEG